MIPLRHGNGRLRLLAAVFILFAAAASLYGRGAKEDSTLSRADELIANKDYDDAIQLLSNYMKTNPDSFREAQARLQKIVQLRERYNQVANELLDTLEAEPENDEKILELSQVLLTIESPSNPTVRRFMDQVRMLAEFNVNKNRLERLLAAARVQLNQNDFSGALATYASGLDIYQKAYFSSGYGLEAEEVASHGLQTINKNIQDFNALAGPFSRAAQALVDLDTSSLPKPEQLASAYNQLLPLMTQLSAMRSSFLDIREAYDTQLAELQKDFDVVGDRSFLSFAGRLITGPLDQNEGMSGTMERAWRYWIAPTETALTNLVRNSYNSGYGAMVKWDFTEGISSFDTTSQYIATALGVIKAWDDFLEGGTTQNYTIYGESVNEEQAKNYLNFRTMDDALVYLKEAGGIGSRGMAVDAANSPALASWQQGLIAAQAAISQEQETRRSYHTLVENLDSLDGKIDSETESLRNYQESLANLPGDLAAPLSYLGDARNLTDNLSSRFRSQEFNSIVRMYTIANGDLEKRTTDREAEYSQGNSLIMGVPRESEEMGVYTVHYPSEGLAILDKMNQNLGPDIETAQALLAQYSAETPDVLNAAEMNVLYVSAQDLLARLLALQGQSTGIIATAHTQIDRANALKLDGDRLFQAAQAALSRNDFDNARSSLARANEQYDASLAIQESDSLRTVRDAESVKLGAEIVRMENEVVVRDVRTMVTAARTSYYAGNMEQAEELLVRAQNRWRVTNITEQPEVEYWLSLVRGALSLQSGRTIPSTAPLYPDMSQLLSDANRSYSEGVKLLTSGQRSDGLAKFDDALQKTREVRLMFPMNHDARMLELRIEQQTDLPSFNAAFQQRISEAVAGTKAKSAESFAELQDLAEINPRYPRIQDILNQAEIDMGLRPPPPNPADLARSTELTRTAQTNINSRDTLRYQIANTQLDEALKLNPNNSQAQSLMDQLQILMTGTGRIVLSSYAQEQYNSALQEYLRGNYLTANAIVQQLLQNPEYQNSIQIQDLKRRIDAVLL